MQAIAMVLMSILVLMHCRHCNAVCGCCACLQYCRIVQRTGFQDVKMKVRPCCPSRYALALLAGI
jgi:hypothetical protein